MLLLRRYLSIYLLLMVLIAVSYYRLYLWQNFIWDGGNQLLFAWRASLGEIPNIDFRSGYPGAFELIAGLVFHFFGSGYEVYAIFLSFFLILAALGVALGTVTWHGPLIAAGLGWGTYLVSSRYLSLEPGTWVQIIFLICFFFLLKGHRTPWIACLLGIAFWFKQTAVLGGVGYGLVLSVDYLRRDRRKDSLFFRTIVLAPHLILLALYFFSRSRSSPSFQNALVLLPWTFAMAVPLAYGFSGKPRETSESLFRHWRDLALNGAVFLLTALGGLATYALFSDQWPQAFREMFLVVPSLIDSLSEEAGFRTKHLLLGALTLALAIWASRSPYLEKNLAKYRVLQIPVLAASVLFAVDHPLFWICFVLPSLFLIFWRRPAIQPWSPAVIFVYSGLGLMFPYPSMEHVGILVLVASALMLTQIRATRFLTAVFFVGLGFATYKFARHIDGSHAVALEKPLTVAPNLKFHPGDRAYFESARLISDLIPKNERASFYPDLALVSYLSGRRPGTFVVNYYANKTTDFDRFVSETSELNWLVVNQKYDQSPASPYIRSHELLRRLPKFLEVARVGPIAIYRRE